MIEKIKKDVQTTFAEDPERLTHTYGVLSTALKFQQKYHLDRDKLTIAALLHDITKNEEKKFHTRLIKRHYGKKIIKDYTEPLFHGFSAAAYAKETYGIKDPDILGMIENHVVGKPAMTLYEKVLYISDYIEPNRPYEACKEVRDIAFDSLDEAVYQAMDNSIRLFEEKGGFIPEIAYRARAYYENRIKNKKEAPWINSE